MKKQFLLRHCLSVCLFASFSSGFLPAPQQIKTSTEEGIPIIHNPKNPAPPPGMRTRMILEEDLVLGARNYGEDQLFLNVQNVRVDDEGNIYVLDRGAAQIKVFDKKGNHLRDIGKKGQGPGEMQAPIGIEFYGTEDLMIYDLGNNRITVFSPSGEVLKEIPAGKLSRTYRLIPDSRGNYISYGVLRTGEKNIIELRKLDNNLELIQRIAGIEETPEPNGVLRLYPAGIRFAVGRNDYVYWADAGQYEIRVVNEEGRLVRKILKDYDPIRITEGMKKREIEERVRERRQPYPPELKLEFPDSYPQIEHFGLSDEGWMSVRTFERSEDGGSFYDIFDPEGRYIAKVSLAFTPRVWKKNQIYSIEEDPEGYQLVKRYRVEWK